MNRREFTKICGMLGLSIPLAGVLTACSEASAQDNDPGKVLIVGAGAAGLSVGYLLQQKGIAFQIVEASTEYGGRMKRIKDFANFPIPLGAEWIHVNPSILTEIVNNPSVNVDIQTTMYKPDVDYALYEGERISLQEAGFSEDSKFVNATWFDFFEQYLVPSVESHITYNAVVESIDYSSDRVQVKTQGETYSADRVVVTAPVKILQNDVISFHPELPEDKRNAIRSARVWDGCKAFIEFSEKFYPAFVEFAINPSSDGQKLYYDAAYGQDTNQHVLGLFAVGTGTKPYIELSDSELIQYMLNELDGIFDGKATPNYIKHTFQNWNAEAYANGAYVRDSESWRTIQRLGESVQNRLFFAGDAYTDGTDWSSVHAAARSAKKAVDDMLRI
jgi:monoamine oxidase